MENQGDKRLPRGVRADDLSSITAALDERRGRKALTDGMLPFLAVLAVGLVWFAVDHNGLLDVATLRVAITAGVLVATGVWLVRSERREVSTLKKALAAVREQVVEEVHARYGIRLDTRGLTGGWTFVAECDGILRSVWLVTFEGTYRLLDVDGVEVPHAKEAC